MDLQAVANPFASAASFLIWLAAVSLAIGTIWKTWLRHVARRTRVAVEAIIELRDLMKTELHLPGDERPGHSSRTSLREDLQALTRVLTDAIEQLKRGNERFSEHEGRLDGHSGRLDDHEVRIVALEGAGRGET